MSGGKRRSPPPLQGEGLGANCLGFLRRTTCETVQVKRGIGVHAYPFGVGPSGSSLPGIFTAGKLLADVK